MDTLPQILLYEFIVMEERTYVFILSQYVTHSILALFTQVLSVTHKTKRDIYGVINIYQNS